MKITFLRDFQSALTNEVFYRKGETVDLEHGAALIAEGAAKAAPEPKPKAEPKPETTKSGTK